MDASTKGPTSVDKFCLRTNSWSSPTASMTGRRLQFGVAVVENKIYVVGGRDGLKTLSTVITVSYVYSTSKIFIKILF